MSSLHMSTSRTHSRAGRGARILAAAAVATLAVAGAHAQSTLLNGSSLDFVAANGAVINRIEALPGQVRSCARGARAAARTGVAVARAFCSR
jgi:hypothetical protein